MHHPNAVMIIWLILGLLLGGFFYWISVAMSQSSQDELNRQDYSVLAMDPREAACAMSLFLRFQDDLERIMHQYEFRNKNKNEEAFSQLNFKDLPVDDVRMEQYRAYKQTGVFEVYSRIAQSAKTTPFKYNTSAAASDIFHISNLYLLRFTLLHAYKTAEQKEYDAAIAILRGYFIVARVFKRYTANEYACLTVRRIVDDFQLSPQELRAFESLLADVESWYQPEDRPPLSPQVSLTRNYILEKVPK